MNCLNTVKLSNFKRILDRIESNRTQSNLFDFVTVNRTRTYSNFLNIFLFFCECSKYALVELEIKLYFDQIKFSFIRFSFIFLEMHLHLHKILVEIVLLLLLLQIKKGLFGLNSFGRFDRTETNFLEKNKKIDKNFEQVQVQFAVTNSHLIRFDSVRLTL